MKMRLLDWVVKNQGLAAGPGMKEAFPALTRGYGAQSAEKASEAARLK